MPCSVWANSEAIVASTCPRSMRSTASFDHMRSGWASM